MTVTWPLDEAAQLLDPPMSVEQLRHLVQAAGLQPPSARRTGGHGHPALQHARPPARARRLPSLLVEAEKPRLKS